MGVYLSKSSVAMATPEDDRELAAAVDSDAGDSVARLAAAVRAAESGPVAQPIAPDGRYELIPIAWAHVETADLVQLGLTVQAMGRAWASRSDELVADVLQDLAETTRRKPEDLIAEAARLHGLLSLPWDALWRRPCRPRQGRPHRLPAARRPDPGHLARRRPPRPLPLPRRRLSQGSGPPRLPGRTRGPIHQQRTAAAASLHDLRLQGRAGGLVEPGHDPASAGCTGTVPVEPAGAAGFGYDPVFVPDEGDGRTFAEMTPQDKHAVSHRGRAFRGLAAALAAAGSKSR